MEYIEFVCNDNLIWSPLAATIGRAFLVQRNAQHRYDTRSSGTSITHQNGQPSTLKLWSMIDQVQSRKELFEEGELQTALTYTQRGMQYAGGFASENLYKKAVRLFHEEHMRFHKEFLTSLDITQRLPNQPMLIQPSEGTQIVFGKEEVHLNFVRQKYQEQKYPSFPLPELWTLTGYAQSIPRQVPEFTLGNTYEKYTAMAKQLSSDVSSALDRYLQKNT